MSLALMITGTDTGVGKTFVGVGLTRAWTRMGLRVAPFKPAETGCLFDEAARTLIPADARLLQSASGSSARLETICPYQFSLPAAPWVAAMKEHRAIELEVLDKAFRELRATHDLVVIETAGGLLVPLTQDLDFGALARRWNTPLVIVAGSRLGVLNQTLLTVRYAESASLRLAGIVLNHPHGDRRTTTLGALHHPALDTNGDILRKMMRYPLWEIPFADSEAAARFDGLYDGLAEALVEGLRAAG